MGKCPYCITRMDDRCGIESGEGHLCNRKKGHRGECVACVPGRHRIATWPKDNPSHIYTPQEEKKLNQERAALARAAAAEKREKRQAAEDKAMEMWDLITAPTPTAEAVKEMCMIMGINPIYEMLKLVGDPSAKEAKGITPSKRLDTMKEIAGFFLSKPKSVEPKGSGDGDDGSIKVILQDGKV